MTSHPSQIGKNLLLTVIILAVLSGPANAFSILSNISTRGKVGTGDNVMIAGFILEGTQPHRILVRALGPTLAEAGVTGPLDNPQITLTKVDGTFIASNDDWKTNANQADILASGRPPKHDNESALLLDLDPNIPFTAIVSGAGGGTGVTLVEVYDMDESNTESKLINISTRGRVETGDNVMIAGFVIGGTEQKKVLIRAIGPSMASHGVANVLANPSIALHRVTGELVARNEDWKEGPAAAEILGLERAPADDKEAALLLTLDPNVPYTPIVSDASGAQGVALVEVYEIPGSTGSEEDDVYLLELQEIMGRDGHRGLFDLQSSPEAGQAVVAKATTTGSLSELRLVVKDSGGIVLTELKMEQAPIDKRVDREFFANLNIPNVPYSLCVSAKTVTGQVIEDCQFDNVNYGISEVSQLTPIGANQAKIPESVAPASASLHLKSSSLEIAYGKPQTVSVTVNSTHLSGVYRLELTSDQSVRFKPGSTDLAFGPAMSASKDFEVELQDAQQAYYTPVVITATLTNSKTGQRINQGTLILRDISAQSRLVEQAKSGAHQ